MQMLIGGHRADASDRKTIQVYNPATLEIVDCVPAATHEDIDTVLNNALSGRKSVGAAFPCTAALRSYALFLTI